MNFLKPMLLTCLKSYDRSQFIKDVTAGIIVAIIALPLSIALALASGVRHQNDQYDDECDGVYHSGDGSPSAIFDIGSGSGDGTCCGDTSKECGSDISCALGNQFHIRTVFAVDHSIGNYTG